MMETCKKLCTLLKTVDSENQNTKTSLKSYKKRYRVGETRIEQLEGQIHDLKNDLTKERFI